MIYEIAKGDFERVKSEMFIANTFFYNDKTYGYESGDEIKEDIKERDEDYGTCSKIPWNRLVL